MRQQNYFFMHILFVFEMRTGGKVDINYNFYENFVYVYKKECNVCWARRHLNTYFDNFHDKSKVFDLNIFLFYVMDLKIFMKIIIKVIIKDTFI